MQYSPQWMRNPISSPSSVPGRPCPPATVLGVRLAERGIALSERHLPSRRVVVGGPPLSADAARPARTRRITGGRDHLCICLRILMLRKLLKSRCFLRGKGGTRGRGTFLLSPGGLAGRIRRPFYHREGGPAIARTRRATRCSCSAVLGGRRRGVAGGFSFPSLPFAWPARGLRTRRAGSASLRLRPQLHQSHGFVLRARRRTGFSRQGDFRPLPPRRLRRAGGARRERLPPRPAARPVRPSGTIAMS